MTPDTELASELRRLKDAADELASIYGEKHPMVIGAREIAPYVAMQHFDQILRALEGGWIPTASRLPLAESLVFIYVPSLAGGRYDQWRYALRKGVWHGDYWSIEGASGGFEVTHWMPLPPMPKAVKP